MGKGTDKLYITHSEWSNDFSEGGMSFGGARGTRPKTVFKRLPFYCCSLSLQPFENPVATKEGVIFDLEYGRALTSIPLLCFCVLAKSELTALCYRNIIAWLKKYKNTNPVTGEPLSPTELVHLHFSKNADGKFHCPVTFKEFTDSSHIVAVAPSGNVYSYDAVKELNIDAKNWRDLLDETVKFTRKDIITLQNPSDLSLRNLEDFWYIRKGVDKPLTEEEEKEKKSLAYKMNTSGLANRILKEMEDSDVASLKADPHAAKSSGGPSSSVYNATQVYSDGRMAASFTSTSLSVNTQAKLVAMDDNDFMYREFAKELKEMRQKIGRGVKKATGAEKGKGYVRLRTNLGDINLELYCEQTPRTCHNFLMLCKTGYYKDVSFHRNIEKFMASRGDPTGTGRGGESFFQRDFEDEIRPNLSHSERGVLSMANRGPGTNSSQFFLTYAPCKHLDGKHTVFGRVVGGLDVLDKMERTPTDEKTARPLRNITILEAAVFVDPFEDWRRRYERRQVQAKEAEAKAVVGVSEEDKAKDAERWLQGPSSTSSGSVGKYLKQASQTEAKRKADTSASDHPLVSTSDKKQKTASASSAGGFGDFSSW
ncbi:cyclophilin peptidyl-prolyl cis-trans isomerase Cyp8 [Sorochytrium milnesiophthora]